MKRTLFVLSVAIVLMLGFLLHKFRAEIAARMWHLRYGNVTRVQGYVVPVPRRWRAMIPDRYSVVLVDSRGNGKLENQLGPNTIAVTLFSHFPGNVDVWKTARSKSLKRGGLQSIEKKKLKTPDQTIVCLGGEVFRDLIHIPSATSFTMGCMSTNKLRITFIGDHMELPEFYDIVSRIHKQ